MYSLKPETYYRLAAAVCASLSNIYYFNGSVAVADGDAECRLTATLIIYRRNVDIFSDEYDSITDVIPVWWECHTTTDEGEVEDDFDFDLFRAEMLSL